MLLMAGIFFLLQLSCQERERMVIAWRKGTERSVSLLLKQSKVKYFVRLIGLKGTSGTLLLGNLCYLFTGITSRNTN